MVDGLQHCNTDGTPLFPGCGPTAPTPARIYRAGPGRPTIRGGCEFRPTMVAARHVRSTSGAGAVAGNRTCHIGSERPLDNHIGVICCPSPACRYHEAVVLSCLLCLLGYL
jgi:hypothetical protein